MKVFMSYSTAADQIVALRLQTLGAIYGLTIYVPSAMTRQTTNPELSTEVQQKLQDSDAVMAVMMHNPTAGAVSEMNWALATGKMLIPIVSDSVSPEYYARFMPHFIVNPADPSETERAIVQFLATKHRTEEANTGLLALATLTLGLFLFSSDSK
jgi:hypothetical protein